MCSRHPISAGAYRWGYREDGPAQATAGPPQSRTARQHSRGVRRADQRSISASSSWERFEVIQQRLADNRAMADALGAPREAYA